MPPTPFVGGAEGDRTPDLRTASATLSQLSYSPILVVGARFCATSRVLSNGRFKSPVRTARRPRSRGNR